MDIHFRAFHQQRICISDVPVFWDIRNSGKQHVQPLDVLPARFNCFPFTACYREKEKCLALE